MNPNIKSAPERLAQVQPAPSHGTPAQPGLAAAGEHQQPSDAADAPPHAAWQARIIGRDFAAIELNQVPDAQAQAVAELCLEHAPGHAETVRRIVSLNENVRLHATQLLKAGAARSPDDQRLLALCILEAGYPIDSEGLAHEVDHLLQDRAASENHYWADKERKFASFERTGTPDVPPQFRGRGLPFFYADPKYDLRNLNGRIGDFGPQTQFHKGNLVCLHLQQASDGRLRAADGTLITTKAFLALELDADASPLNHARLKDAAQAEMHRTHGINFQSEQFGSLLRELSLDLPVGEERSFPVAWRKKNSGHALRVFLKKQPDGFFKVGVYEPNVTRNIVHEKVLPERLCELRWDDFDTKNGRVRCGVEVLNLRVDDGRLAARCAGKFVSQEQAARVASLGQSLAAGDHAEVARLLADLRANPIAEFTPADLEELEGGLGHALLGTDRRGVALFMAALKELGIPAAQMAEIAMARTLSGRMGVCDALERGEIDMVVAFFEGLHSLRLEPAQVFAILMGKGAKNDPLALHVRTEAEQLENSTSSRRPDELVLAFLSLLNGLPLSQEQIVEIVNASNMVGSTLLGRIVERGDRTHVESFIAGLRQLRLRSDLVAEVFEAPDSYGYPALASAMNMRNWDAMRRVLSGCATLGLDTDQLARIAAARHAHGTPGMFLAIRNGDTDGVQRFLDDLRTGHIPVRLIVDGLIARNAKGESALTQLLALADPKVLDALSAAIVGFAPSLSTPEKKKLLDALHAAQGTPRPWYQGGLSDSEAIKRLKKHQISYAGFRSAKSALRQ